MKWLLNVTCATLGATFVQSALAQTSLLELADRIELHSIQSLTLSDNQFLSGDTNGTSVTISGELRVAQGTGRLPVVVLQHGSGGIGANVDMWSKEFNSMGVSTFVLDGFTGRGLTGVNEYQSVIGRLNFILDTYRALDRLVKHPRVDPQRIMLMGFSRGGTAALYASLKRFNKIWNKSGIEFAAYISFYPDCAMTFVADTDVTDRPIRVFGGAPDDYNPISVCKPYVERLKASGHNVQLTEFPNAPHVFDSPLMPRPAISAPKAQSARNCIIREEPLGVLINAATNAPFTDKDACVTLGPHVGYDPDATGLARQEVTAFVRTTFKMK
jgi:dienelactone hydrolase